MWQVNAIRRVLLFVCIALGMPLAYCADGVAVDNDWLTLRDVSLDILPGSALDFSKFFPTQTASPLVPIGQNAAGQLQAGGKRQRFLCAPMVLTPPYGGFPTHAQSDRYATQLRRAGYNLARLMHVETTLMTDQDGDFNYNTEQIDRFHYLLAALKKEGIYWMIDAMTSDNGSYGSVRPHRWIEKHDLKRRLYFDPAAKVHWRMQVELLFGRKNPYTGQSVLHDPALMGMSVVNEGGLNFLSHLGRAVPPGLTPQLTKWLQSQYSPTEFERRWQTPYSTLEEGKLPLPNPRQPSPQMDDVLRFYEKLQYENGKWMELQLRQLGFTGLVTGYNNMASTSADRARATFSWIDMHYYHDEGLGFQPGASIKNTSSLEDGLSYVRGLAATRQAGKPFTVSEYGQPFWNQWRREMIAVPAYAALHDWDAICQHASTAVDFTYVQSTGWKRAIHPYAVGLDPVTRAVETLSALLYRRGDVKVSKEYIDLNLTFGQQDSSARYWGADAKTMTSALVLKTMTRFPDMGNAAADENRLGSLTLAGILKMSNKSMIDSHKSDLASTIAHLTNLNNKTNTSNGIFESITGEIKLDTRKRRLEIDTPKTVVAVIQDDSRLVPLGPLQISALSAPALVALTAIDDKPLTSSRHMLLILVSDALNTDMRFEDASRKKLLTLGRLPARLNPMTMKFSLKTIEGDVQVSPLSLAGKKLESTLQKAGFISIDWRTQSYGPTIYYEIEIK